MSFETELPDRHPTNESPSIDYDAVSTAYDLVRAGDREMVGILLKGASLSRTSRIIDVGCGTTNNTILLQAATNAQVVGLDLSLGMLKQACKKSNAIQLVQSPASSLPFRASAFDFIFMTEVIHHLSDYPLVLKEIFMLLESCGSVCIVTQSHRQVEERMTSRFFPATVRVDCSRYPSIPSIESTLDNLGFSEIVVELHNFTPVRLGEEYFETVSRKGYSMLHKISDADYKRGLDDLRTAMANGEDLSYSAGYSFVWASK